MRMRQRDDDLEPLAHPQHVLELAAPLQRIARRQLQLVAHRLLRLVDVAADVLARKVHVHVARHHAILVPDHRRAERDVDVGDGSQRNLGARHGRDQHPLELLQIVAVIAGVAHVHAVAFRPLNGGGDVLPADSRHDNHLGVLDGQPVAGQLLSLEGEIHEVAAGHPLRIHAAGPGQRLDDLLELHADLLDLVELGPIDLDADGRAHAGREHVDPRLDGHGPGVGDAGNLHLGVELVDQLVPRQPRPPVLLVLEDHRRLHHGKRRRVRGRVGPPRLAEHPLHLRERRQDLVLNLEQVGRLRDGQAGQRRRHVENRALVQRRHELRAQAEVHRHGDDHQQNRNEDRQSADG